jgi:ABC-type branched-subunit amino acid transport system substrate-binding protein
MIREYSYGAGAAGAAAAAAAVANALKASGAIVKIAPDQFMKILARMEEPLIAVGQTGFLKKKPQYLTNYKGLFFYCVSEKPLTLPSKAEIVITKSIWVP